jgi:hypothetical protein
MEGGAVIGEGVDGCVLSEPIWPCAASSKIIGHIPDGKDKTVVSKIVRRDDDESSYLEAANRILGPQLSVLYLAGLKGMCAPANSTHLPSKERLGDLVEDKKDLYAWKGGVPGLACDTLKKAFKKGITDTHKLMIISRYPSTLLEWVNTVHKKKIPVKYVMDIINNAIPSFLNVLQMFYKNKNEELINVDLHHMNIFTRTSGNNLQFGISDFGHSLLRLRNDEKSNRAYFATALSVLHVNQNQPIYMYYRQIAFEARILNFCYVKKLENSSPDEIMKRYVNEPDVKEFAGYANDILIKNLSHYTQYLLKCPLFIEMLEVMQGIIKKTRIYNQPPFDEKEKVVIEFMLTRYMAISPIVTIIEQLLYLSDDLYQELEVVTSEYFNEKDVPMALALPRQSGGAVLAADLSTGTGIHKLVTYVNRMVTAPYSGKGSLVDSLNSVIAADLRSVWLDID